MDFGMPAPRPIVGNHTLLLLRSFFSSFLALFYVEIWQQEEKWHEVRRPRCDTGRYQKLVHKLDVKLSVLAENQGVSAKALTTMISAAVWRARGPTAAGR